MSRGGDGISTPPLSGSSMLPTTMTAPNPRAVKLAADPADVLKVRPGAKTLESQVRGGCGPCAEVTTTR
jgi:hypothetical protein